MERRFRDRSDAGRQLSELLQGYTGRGDVVVLALPRGGVPVAAEIASALGAPLDVFVVRKLGVPGHEELAMGAIASGGVVVVNDEVLHKARVSERAFNAVVAHEAEELELREQVYRQQREPVPVDGKTVVLVDDGLATGSTMRAAVKAIRKRGPATIVIAVPVAPASVCRSLESEVDEVLCARMPRNFHAVGESYERFTQLTDDDVVEILHRASYPSLTGQEGGG